MNVNLMVNARRDHLRVCGADDQALASFLQGEGSPPRVRSRPHVMRTNTPM